MYQSLYFAPSIYSLQIGLKSRVRGVIKVVKQLPSEKEHRLGLSRLGMQLVPEAICCGSSHNVYLCCKTGLNTEKETSLRSALVPTS